MASKLILLLLFLSLSFVEGQLGRDLGLKQRYTNFQRVRDFYTLYYGFDQSASQINIAFIWDLTGSNLGWAAFAPNSTDMPNSDVWMIARNSSGSVNVWDMHVANDFVRPDLDSVQNVNVNNTVINATIIIVEVNRKGNTLDSNDTVVIGTETALPALYAFNPTSRVDSPTAPTYHGSSNRGRWEMNFVAQASITNPVTVQSAFSSSSSPTSTSGSIVREVTPLPGYKLSWTFPDSETIEFTMSSQSSGWIGLGFGTSMLNADMYIGNFLNGNAQVLDYFGVQDQARPTLDTAIGGTNSVISSSGTRANGVTTFVFRRRLVTGDSRDKDIVVNGQTDIIVAFGSDDALNYHGGPNRTPYTVNFATGASDNDAAETLRRKHTAHGVIMAVSWAIFVPFMIIISRYFKNIGHPWFIIHTGFGIFVLILVIVAFAIGVSMVEGPQFQQKDKTRISHAWIGLFVFIFIFFQIILGFVAHKMWSPEREKTPWFPDRIHHWIGRIIFLLAIINIFLGLASLTDANYRTYLGIYGAWVGVLVIVFIVLEVVKKKKSD